MGSLLWYNGEVDPEAPNSAGPGLSWTQAEGTRGMGSVVNDTIGTVNETAIDGKAFRINDLASANLSFRGPLSDIEPTTGATILARLKLPGDTGINGGTAGENIAIWEGDAAAPNAMSAGMHWSGRNGKEVRENYRNAATPIVIGNIPSKNYHIIRLTAVDTGGPDGIVIRQYFDENRVPVRELLNAVPKHRGIAEAPAGLLGDAFGFGVSDNPAGTGHWDVYFDWVTASDAGAFAPGDEVAVIGRSLVVPEPTSLTLLIAGLCALLRRR